MYSDLILAISDAKALVCGGPFPALVPRVRITLIEIGGHVKSLVLIYNRHSFPFFLLSLVFLFPQSHPRLRVQSRLSGIDCTCMILRMTPA